MSIVKNDVLNMRNNKTHEKLRMIREAECLGRNDFSRITGFSKRTIESLENKGTDPRASYLIKVCSEFPEYVFWLMIGKTDISIGQIDPKMKIKWRLCNNLKGKGIIKFDLNNKQHLEQMKSAIELELDKMISINKDLL